MSANGLANKAVLKLESNRNGESSFPRNTSDAERIDSALSALSAYIPAEAMALYLAVSSSLPVILISYPSIKPSFVYWFFAWAISPGLFLMAYFVKLSNSGSPFPSKLEFPWFRLFSSILAFGIWGRCVPGNPFAPLTDPGAGVLYGILATFVSITLPSVEAIYDWIVASKMKTST